MNITEDQYKSIEEFLPESAKDIISVIGCDKAFELFSLFGGVQVMFSKGEHVPRGSELHEMIKLLIGDDYFVALQRHYSGDRLYIPNCKTAELKLKQMNVTDEYFNRISGGVNPSIAKVELCRLYKVSARMIYKWVADYYQKRKIQTVS